MVHIPGIRHRAGTAALFSFLLAASYSHASDDAPDKSALLCPGESITLGYGINVVDDVCVKMFDYMNAEPVSVEFWNISRQGVFVNSDIRVRE
jgi:hypothetical protein